ncbi:MAG: peptidase U32 family protein [Desulfovibrionaceae bacterium]
MKTLPELLAPAGSMEKLEIALLYGADAVYLGGTGLNLRAGTGGFTWEDLDIALNKAHSAGAKVYYCLNSIVHDKHKKELEDSLERLSSSAIDGLIIADPGVLHLAKKIFPSAEIHLSTQANTVNSSAIAFWRDYGVHRVNLARELNILEMRDIAKNVTGIELEAFVHGAMCMAVSGQCHMSQWTNGRDANLGACTQPCRFEYAAEEEPISLALKEKKRDRALWYMEEDEEYTKIFASEDLCLIKYVPWFLVSGIHSLKIEGRMKSIAYLAYAVDAYKTAMVDFAKGTFTLQNYLTMLSSHASRPLSSGFFLPNNVRKTFTPLHPEKTKTIVARVEEQLSPSTYKISVRQPWDTSQTTEALYPRQKMLPLNQYSIENTKGEKQSKVHPGMKHILHFEGDLNTGILLQQ